MCHNPGTWHNCTQVKLTSEGSCQRTNCKTKYKLETQNPLGKNRANVTWKHLCQCHLGTIVPVSLGNNRAVSLGNNCASLTWERLYQCHFGTIAGVSLENNCASVIRINSVSLTWELSWQCSLGTTVPVSLGNNLASSVWEQI